MTSTTKILPTETPSSPILVLDDVDCKLDNFNSSRTDYVHSIETTSHVYSEVEQPRHKCYPDKSQLLEEQTAISIIWRSPQSLTTPSISNDKWKPAQSFSKTSEKWFDWFLANTLHFFSNRNEKCLLKIPQENSKDEMKVSNFKWNPSQATSDKKLEKTEKKLSDKLWLTESQIKW